MIVKHPDVLLLKDGQLHAEQARGIVIPVALGIGDEGGDDRADALAAGVAGIGWVDALGEGHRVGGQREAGKRAVEVGALCAEFVPKFVTDEREKRLAVGGVDQNRVGAVGLGGGAPRGIGAGLNEQHAFAEGCADQL